MLTDYQSTAFILRTPLIGVDKLLNLLSDYSDEKLVKEFSDPTLQEALFIASPTLYSEIYDAIQNGGTIKEKAIQSLLKYYSRAGARCTPYGLFGMVSVGNISEGETNIKVKRQPYPRIRLDMDYLCDIYNEVQNDPLIYKHLIYYPNSSLFKVGSKWKYIDYKYVGNKRKYSLSFVDGNSVLNQIFKKAKKGTYYEEIINLITRKGYEREDAEEFVMELIDSQVIISEISPSVSGEEYQDILFSKLKLFKGYEALGKVEEIMQKSEANSSQTKFVTSKEILQKIFSTEINDRTFFQVDSSRQTVNSTIAVELLEELKECATVLNKITNSDIGQTNLERFRKEFYERYEDAEVPLLEVMDSEIGIDYNNIVTDDGGSRNGNNMKWDKISKFYFDTYLKAQRQNLKTIEITEADVKHIPEPRGPIANSMSLTSKLLTENGQTKVFWKILTGPSPLYFFGRFGYLDKRIEELCVEIAKKEEKNDPHKVFAEIVHLPEDRMGNVLLRPHYRQYEIPYLTLSRLPLENQITIDDLLVSVRANKVVLRSKKLNKYVEPRMANAHNFRAFGLSIYHFLCDLQFQGVKTGFKWSWNFLSNEPFLPRVTYKNVILSLATWNLKTQLLVDVLKKHGKEKYIEFAKVKKQLGIPNYVVYVVGDRELLLNLELPVCIDILLSYSGGIEIIELTEFLFNSNNCIVQDEDGNGYANEVMIPFVKKANEAVTSSITKVQTNKLVEHKVQRSFPPYSEWIFVKLFCGYKIGDKIVGEILRPLCKKLIKEKVIDKWFFIRYADPKHHIRVRFHVNGNSNIAKLHKYLDETLKNYVETKLIWKVQFDTYNRELERYGFDTIEITENFFYRNSKCVAELTKLFSSDKNGDIRFIIGLYGVHCLYEAFGISLKDRIPLVEASKRMFAIEFNVAHNKNLREQIKRDYREVNPRISQLIENFPKGDEVFDFIKAEFDAQSRELRKLLSELNKQEYSKNIYQLIPSYIHMFVNRFFNSGQRMNEMFIYQFLSKYYSSQLARDKANENKVASLIV